MSDRVNILLVDDEPKNLTTLEAVLERDDWNLVAVTSGREALRHLLDEEFAVILLDVHMPDMDGFETAELIRSRDRTRDTPIIFLTAAIRGETFVARGYSLGAVDYIVKPFDPDVLRSKVSVFVELFRRTEQVKRQAEQLAETTEFLNSVLESATEYAITAMDLDGRIVAWNEGARRIYGYGPEEMVGRESIARLHPAEGGEQVEALLKTALRTGKATVELEQVRKNGRRFSALVTINRRQDTAGTPVGFVGITRDITAVKRAERERTQLIEAQAARAEAETARDRLQQMVDVLPLGIAVADATGTVYVGNAAAEEILGHTLVGATAEVDTFGILRLDGAPCPPGELPLARAVLRGEVVRGEQLLIPNTVTGRQVPVLVNAAPLRDADGSIVGGVVAFQDITEIKELEQQKDAFLAAVSHDLKNPLTAIKARAQMLERRAGRLETPDGQQLADGMRAIDQTVTRVTGMINQLLDVARLQMGRPLDLDREPMDLVELAREVVAEFEPSSEGHAIEVESTQGTLVGTWDRARLERVLANLVSNAIKYSPDGGRITLRVGPDAENGATWAMLEVKDEGLGIPATELPQVFDRFYRASNVAGRIEGTGIGLAGARQIVEQHGGCISVDSRERVGSTFTVRLPLEAPAAP